MDNKEYIELYNKLPKDILNYVVEDMIKVLVHSEIDDNVADKIGEWRYILMRAESKMNNNN